MRLSIISLGLGLILTPSAHAQLFFNNDLPTAAPLTVPTTPSQVKIERTQPITLEEAIAIANRSNRDIIQARITVDRNRASLREAEAARLPTVTASGSYTFNDSAQARLGNISSGFASANGFGSSSTITQPVSGTVGLNYNIYTSGLVEANIKAAENQLRISELALNQVTQTVKIAVITAYYNLQNTDENVRIQQKSVENNQVSLRDTTALERAGVGTKFDVLTAQVQLANAQQALLDAQASQLIARRELARQIEYPNNLDLAAADKIAPVEPWKLTIEDTILLALKNRTELDTQKLQREVARERARASIARLGPQIALTGNLDTADNFNQAGGFALGYRVGVNVSISLFDGGVASAQVDQFKADQALAESQFQQAANQVRFDVEQAFINSQSRSKQIDTATKAVEQSTEALRLARLRLSAGVGTQLEVINAENSLTQADVNRTQAIIGYNQAISNLKKAVNGL
ncbi:outer membrane protein [Synechococcus sp. PCC 7502]|uniref:TolC family protein n=1 Tax=Synechococcus sp. PCC 7502 TaxID=1173263 RepID=UPI00029FDE34|nr:TolC family protein [Synechococcus sp. PCC 7502]AFY72977.1 outer membrane protein [Synechococcus sp. PCC 7502]